MNTDELLRRLAPLLPEQVAHWRLVLQTGDETLKRLVERQIHLVGGERLGATTLLLSLPSREQSRGEFQLGTLRYDGPKWPFGLSQAELLQNVAIFGRSGAGKTNVLFHLLTQLTEKNVPWLFLDWKRTGRHLIPLLKQRVHLYTPGRDLHPLNFNPLVAPPGLSPHAYAPHVVDSLARAYTLGDGAKSLIERALRSAYDDGVPADPAELLRRIRGVVDRERVAGWKTSAIRALETLVNAQLITADSSKSETVEQLLHQTSIIELDSLASNAKRFLLPLLCLWIYHTRLAARSRERLELVVVIEEAHHVLHKGRGPESTMEMLLRQCREIGIGIVVVDQHPSLISRAALGNTYTSVCLNLKDPTDVQVAAKLSRLAAADGGLLSSLPTGQGVVKLQDRWHQPVLVDFPLVEVEKGSVSDAHLRDYLLGTATLSGATRSVARNLAALGRPRIADEARFLEDVETHPNDGVDVRYKRLGMSADKGTRLKARLVTLGLLEEESIRMGRTRKHILRLTSRASGARHETIAHEYWKRWYAEELTKQGYDVVTEAPRPTGGAVDVLATRASETVAIEIETGSSTILENVRRDLLAGYQRVRVVATTPQAWLRTQRSLARAGLLIPQVRLDLAGSTRPHRTCRRTPR